MGQPLSLILETGQSCEAAARRREVASSISKPRQSLCVAHTFCAVVGAYVARLTQFDFVPEQ
jgi:hypothetical protein